MYLYRSIYNTPFPITQFCMSLNAVDVFKTVLWLSSIFPFNSSFPDKFKEDTQAQVFVNFHCNNALPLLLQREEKQNNKIIKKKNIMILRAFTISKLNSTFFVKKNTFLKFTSFLVIMFINDYRSMSHAERQRNHTSMQWNTFESHFIVSMFKE